jgi:hypothetical protein
VSTVRRPRDLHALRLRFHAIEWALCNLPEGRSTESAFDELMRAAVEIARIASKAHATEFTPLAVNVERVYRVAEARWGEKSD